MRDERVKRLALGGMLASLVLLATWFLKVPTAIGYIHLGDGVIFFSSMVIGPYAALIAGVGSALADLLSGYAIYIAPTFIIKAVMGLIAAVLIRPGKHISNLGVFALAEGCMVAGYFLFEAFAYNWASAMGSVGPNMLQGAAGIALGMVFSLYYPRLKNKI